MIIFISSIFFLYFFSKKTLNELYFFLKKILRKNSIVYMAIACIFFPGTLAHELSHALMARILLLKVTEITLIPEWKNNSIRLGRVTYIRGGIIRSIIVGVAPVIGGAILLLWMAIANIFPQTNVLLNALLLYIIFVVTSTMFSSKQDLIDVGYLIPFVVIGAAIIFIFKINIFQYITTLTKTGLGEFLNLQISKINIMMGVALATHIFMIVTLKILNKILS